MKKNTKGEFMVIDEDYNEANAYDVHNKIIEQEMEKFKASHVNDKAEQIVRDANDLEIVPINAYVLVKPYDVNPYQKIDISEGGIALNTTDASEFHNPDSGEDDHMDQFIKVATVIECSPLNRYVRQGDDVIYKIGTAVPVPFFRMGMYVVPETSILAVVNKGLIERFKTVK